MDLCSELMKAFQNVSLSFQSDEVDEGFKSSSQDLMTSAEVMQESSSSRLLSVGELPHLVEVWGIDPLMKNFFESIYPGIASHSTHDQQ